MAGGGTLKEIIAGRKKILREIKARARTLDSWVEKTQRKMNQLLGRKQKVLELKDFQKVGEYLIEIGQAYSTLSDYFTEVEQFIEQGGY